VRVVSLVAARKMAILVPALDPKTGKPMCGKVKLLDEFKRTGQSTESLVALVNKSPGEYMHTSITRDLVCSFGASEVLCCHHSSPFQRLLLL
jgi:hypothetical protein